MLDDFGALEVALLGAVPAAAGGLAAAGAGVAAGVAADVLDGVEGLAFDSAEEGLAEGFEAGELAANHVFTPLWPPQAPAFFAALV